MHLHPALLSFPRTRIDMTVTVDMYIILPAFRQELPQLNDADPPSGQHAVLQAVQILSMNRRDELP